MSGSLTELAAIGQQDVYLTGQPDFTFWKCGYQQHTNYAVEPVELTFQSAPQGGRKVTCPISRNGDLVYEIFVQIQFETLANSNADGGEVYFCDALGHAAIDYVDIEIGGHRHDRWYGDFLEIWSELSDAPANEKREKIFKFDSLSERISASADPNGVTCFVPLQFWFNRHRCHALPMIALQYHEVKLHVSFKRESELIIKKAGAQTAASGPGSGMIKDASLLVDYVFLDTAERRMFAQQPHEYLIDQLQFVGSNHIAQGSDTTPILLNFNHPVKEIVWVMQQASKIAAGELFDFSAPGGAEPLKKAKLQLNGHSRFEDLSAKYFRILSPYKHHTRIPKRFIYVFSFAAHPETYEPTGSCNFSRIDTVTLVLEHQNMTGEARIYARSVNVLRILSGMAGLRYAN